MARGQTFYASVATVVGIVVFVAAACCAALFAVADVFGQPLVCGGRWYDLSFRVATFSQFIAANNLKGTSFTRCSYVMATVTHVFAGSFTARMSADGYLDCTAGPQECVATPAGKTRDFLHLNDNKLTGSIPPQISELTALTRL
jgi:hypothetical protein